MNEGTVGRLHGEEGVNERDCGRLGGEEGVNGEAV